MKDQKDATIETMTEAGIIEIVIIETVIIAAEAIIKGEIDGL